MKTFQIPKIYSILLITLLWASCSTKEVPHYQEKRTPVAVKIAQVSLTNTQNQFQISGLVASDHQVEISAKTTGYLEVLKLEIGDKVKKGMRLARIKNQEVDAKIGQVEGRIEEAEITLQAIEKDYQRIKRLFSQQSATQKELDDITTLMKSTKARIKQLESSKSEAQIMSAYSEIKSPISGIVTAKYKSQGELAHPGQPLLKIEDDRTKVIEISLSESHIKKVAKGTKVLYKLESETLWQTGKITEISTAAEQGQYPAKIALPGNNSYLAGMFTEVIVTLNTLDIKSNSKALLTVPKSAIIHKGQLVGIFVPSDQNTALLRWIIPGKELGEQIEVLSGLDENESYILDAESRLMNGMPIENKKSR